MSDHYEIVETCALDPNDASQYTKPWLLVGIEEVLEFDSEEEATNAMQERAA
ncbi:TPA: hypothetical protein RSR62_003305 [Klebsiella pneumoniae]|nr:hypothetical protein [Klebsiella pneumoniae]HDZ2382474.1 hypothetical protein [Klebsiella pneumoniae]